MLRRSVVVSIVLCLFSFQFICSLEWEVFLVQCVLQSTIRDIQQIYWLVLPLWLPLPPLLVVGVGKVLEMILVHSRSFEIAWYSFHAVLAHSRRLLPDPTCSFDIYNSLLRIVIQVNRAENLCCIIQSSLWSSNLACEIAWHVLKVVVKRCTTVLRPASQNWLFVVLWRDASSIEAIGMISGLIWKFNGLHMHLVAHLLLLIVNCHTKWSLSCPLLGAASVMQGTNGLGRRLPYRWLANNWFIMTIM